MKAILTHKPQSIYDDLPWERYHFPRTYLRQIEQAASDLVIYYEPRREGVGDAAYRGRQAYIATAKIIDIRSDLKSAGHFYADIDGFCEFERPVPFRHGDSYYESSLRKGDGSTNRGSFGRAVRLIPDHEFDAIVWAGFAEDLPLEHGAARQDLELAEQAARPFWWSDQEAPLERANTTRVLSTRAFRDRTFRRIVQEAYDGTCAFTGLRLINGGGRLEAEAAHIKPVEDRGPDTVRNGLSLSGTVHWMFDRGLVTVAEDRSILISDLGLPKDIRRLFHSDGKARFPVQPWLQPAPSLLRYHRETKFKG